MPDSLDLSFEEALLAVATLGNSLWFGMAFDTFEAFTGGLTPEVMEQGRTMVSGSAAKGLLFNTPGNTAPIPVVYGERRIGGIPILRTVSGIKNRKLHQIHVLSEGPIEAIDACYFNDTEVSIGEEIEQQSLFTYAGTIDRRVRFRLKVVDDTTGSGPYVDSGDDIPALYAADGGFLEAVESKGEGWISASMNITPFTSAQVTTGQKVYLNVIDKTEDSYFTVHQHPTEANGWILDFEIGDGTKDANLVNIQIGISRTAKFVDESYSTASEVWPILGNQWLGNARSAADEAVLARIASAIPEAWGNSDKLNRLAAVYVVLDYNPDVFQSLPTVSCNIKGKHVLDIRDDVEKYSSNPVLCVRDYMTNDLYGSRIPVADINIATAIAEANYCDEIIGYGQKRYSCDGVINVDSSPYDNLKQMASCCRMIRAWIGGQWHLNIDKAVIAPETEGFDESNILGGWTISPQNKKNVYNEINAKFFNKHGNWLEDIEPVSSDVLRSYDGGTVLRKDIGLPFTNVRWRANHLATMALNVSRQQLAASFTATRAATKFVVGSVVPIVHSFPGWGDVDIKYFRIVAMDFAGSEIGVSVIEHETASYNFTQVIEDAPEPDTDLPDFENLPAPEYINAESGTDHLLVFGDGTMLSRIYANFGPVEYCREYEFQYKRSADTGWTSIISIDTDTMVSGVDDGVDYDLRVRGVSVLGPGQWSSVVVHTVIGKTEPPGDVQQFNVVRQPDGTREFTWNQLADLDLAGYLIRWSLVLTDTWDDMQPLNVGFLISSPFETNQLAKGTYVVAIKGIDNSGNESTNAKYIQSTLGDPRIEGAFYTEYPERNGWPGFKTNCEVDSAGGCLTAKPNYTWNNLTSWNAWEEWAKPGFPQIIYETNNISLGALVTFVPLVSTVHVGDATYQMKVSTDGGTTFSPSWLPLEQVTATHIKLRTTLDQAASETLQFCTMSIILSGDVIEETINDSNVSSWNGSASGGWEIPITLSYSVILSIKLALQNVGSGYSWEITSKDTTTPKIKIYNGSTATSAVVDVEIKGYPLG